MLVQDNNLYLISFSILITCLLDNVWILKGEITCSSLPGVKELNFVILRGQMTVLVFHLTRIERTRSCLSPRDMMTSLQN